MNASTQPFLAGMESEQRRRDLSQYFTPAWLSLRLFKWANVKPTDRILEPAAGRGSLLKPMLGKDARIVVAYEIDPNNVEALERLQSQHRMQAGWAFELRARDYMADADVLRERFDVAIVNTPYEDGQDVAFAERMLQHCPRVCGVFRSSIRNSGTRSGFWGRVRPTRVVELSERPDFGQCSPTDRGAQSEFCVMELVRRVKPVLVASAVPQATPCTVEWW